MRNQPFDSAFVQYPFLRAHMHRSTTLMRHQHAANAHIYHSSAPRYLFRLPLTHSYDPHAPCGLYAVSRVIHFAQSACSPRRLLRFHGWKCSVGSSSRGAFLVPIGVRILQHRIVRVIARLPWLADAVSRSAPQSTSRRRVAPGSSWHRGA
jgi:hypothetical protein